MSYRTIMLVPTEPDVGLTSVILGIIHAIKQKNINLKLFRPISQLYSDENKFDNTINNIYTDLTFPYNKPIPINYVITLLKDNKQNLLMQKIISQFYKNNNNTKVILIEGLIPTCRYHFANMLNYDIAQTLNAEIIFVSTLKHNSIDKIKEYIELICLNFNNKKNKNIKGIIINKLNYPTNYLEHFCLTSMKIIDILNKNNSNKIDSTMVIKTSQIPIIGCIPWNFDLINISVIDIAKYLNAIIIYKEKLETKYVKYLIYFRRDSINETIYLDSILIIQISQLDLLIDACLTTNKNIKFNTIMLIDNGSNIEQIIKKMITYIFFTKIPILIIKINIWDALIKLQNFKIKTPINNLNLIKKVQIYIANYIDNFWVKSLITKTNKNFNLSPSIFQYKITKLARQANKRIVLPEGDELRTMKAASICAKLNIANCILLGNPKKIKEIASIHNIDINKNIEILNTEKIENKYINRLFELRKNKGITETLAKDMLKDNVVLGTLMLELGEVDGLVSGTIHTTANTIRPSLQLIKTAPNNSLVSSIFFMLLPKQVLIYADCAININPTAEQLAEIAIQTANSAINFNIKPIIAMISYSTGFSSKGKDVEKIHIATKIVQNKRPDLIIDGPLQYDAAIITEVALCKAPNSPVAGKATIIIFPDLNTGNTTYKAVQRSADIISIGPILQGLRKPVNDLSRGAKIDDIIYTIAITAIQSNYMKC